MGGPSGRLVTDKQLFDIQFAYAPDAPPQITIQQWIPAVYLPVTTPVTGFNAKTELLNQIFLVAGANNALTALSPQQNEVWYYRFHWDQERRQSAMVASREPVSALTHRCNSPWDGDRWRDSHRMHCARVAFKANASIAERHEDVGAARRWIERRET